MNEIFDLKKLPERRVFVSKLIALHKHEDISREIQIIKEEIARRVAEVLLKDQSFFWSKGGQCGGFATLEYGANCIVLTDEEFAEVKRQSFQDGIQHASGFRPREI